MLLSRSRQAMSIDMSDDAALEAALAASTAPAVTTLASAQGQALLLEAEVVLHYKLLYPHWRTQVGRRNCGLASASVLVSSIPGDTFLAEDEILTTVAKSGRVPAWHELATAVEARGLVLEELGSLLRGLPGVSAVRCVHCGEQNETVCAGDVVNEYNESPVAKVGGMEDVEAMRKSVLQALSDPNARCIVNYHMATAGQVPFGGHFSTVAAYHRDSDRFLILDCWPATEPLWVQAAVLWAATEHGDADAGRPRGFIFASV